MHGVEPRRLATRVGVPIAGTGAINRSE